MRILTIIIALFLSINTLFGAIQKETIIPVMKGKIDTVTTLIQQKDLSREVLVKKIFDLFDPVFDYALMTKLSLGAKQWKMLSTKQKARFTKRFEERLKSSYVEKLDLYTDEIVTIKELKPVKTRLKLLTELIGKEETYKIDYKFYNAKEKGWLIYDVDVLGVSIIQTYRSQFAGVLKEKSFDEFLKDFEAPVTNP